MNISASPGIAIIEEIEEKEEGLVLSQKKEGRIIKGKILSMGSYDTQHGEKIEPERFGKVGDVVYFLSYYVEGGVDYGVVEGRKIYFVKWGDFRAISKH